MFVWSASAQDPPTRVADLNYINGNVSMQPAGDSEWSPAMMNRPFTTGDYLWTDTNSRAELHLDGAVLRLSPETSAGFLNLDDRIVQLRFTQGELILSVQYVGDGQSFEVDTPNAAITIMGEGEYRFNADPDSAATWVVVRRGEAEVTGGGQSFVVTAGNTARLSGTDQLAFDVEYAPPPDWFESWSEDRDAQEARVQSARYVPQGVIGYEELDNYGAWRDVPGYGSVWYPAVDVNWAPYHNGHWAWIDPWGWTWVDDAPWGFAPFHYGRWAYIGNGWGWVPGPVAIAGGPRVRPVYAPALVAFIGGDNWGVSLSVGGPAVGWVPLGPGELYAPAYHVSPGYFRTVNVSNTTVVNNINITNVYNNVYVNRTVTNVTVNQRFANMAAPNAVSAMPQNAFASGRPVRQVGITVPRNQVAQLHPGVMQVRPQVTAVRQPPAPAAGGRPIVRPPARALAAPVVAKTAPPRTPGAAPIRVAPPARSVVLQPHPAQPAGGGFHPQPGQSQQPVRPQNAEPQRPGAPPVRVSPPTPAVTAQPRPAEQPPQTARPPAAVPRQQAVQPPANTPRPQTAQPQRVPPPQRQPEPKAAPKGDESKPKHDEKKKEPGD
ncbi:MAG TPA: DUF6600 domain-containing protein [Bryobacteraceae bacterium]|nr:DUF6600 domain-containing protein [Bryobacteraceae bacterium]